MNNIAPQMKPQETSETPRVCSRCICDTTVPGTRFDDNGQCNWCDLHDQLNAQFPLGEEGRRRLEAIAEKVKRSGRGKKYDCILGIGGGRDSCYMAYLAVQMGLRPLAVHFNDGFGNPQAGENMTRVTKALGLGLRIVTSDWRESKDDLKLAFLRASTPDLEEGTDVGIAATLYAEAVKEGVSYILSGHSFRNEGIMPLEWNYLDGYYLKKVHERFGTVPLRPWKPDDAGFHLDIRQVIYYALIKRIRVVPLLYYLDYDRKKAAELLERELGWVYPGAKYFDDLYQALMTYVYRVKFGIDRRKVNYSAFVREGQMGRDEALEKVAEIYGIEDQKVIDLCIKRIGMTHEEFEEILNQPPKVFTDYPTRYPLLKLARLPVWLLARLGVLPAVTYAKYFKCVSDRIR